ncbi:MAG: hypothetical protein KIS92_13425 [Planctomycetota bacterium]|nr:hypothetical protein [Planctomycetota bacterium]
MLKAAKDFVTVCIYNNVRGKDAEVLKAFREPAWNNPVVRFLDATGQDLIPRKDGVYRTEDLLERMKRALEKSAQAAGKSADPAPDAKTTAPDAGK